MARQRQPCPFVMSWIESLIRGLLDSELRGEDYISFIKDTLFSLKTYWMLWKRCHSCQYLLHTKDIWMWALFSWSFVLNWCLLWKQLTGWGCTCLDNEKSTEALLSHALNPFCQTHNDQDEHGLLLKTQTTACLWFFFPIYIWRLILAFLYMDVKVDVQCSQCV